uniref:Ig-like domain-containing protein n=1 Tax=Seriola lalandi dorsalis TaxID=1841481 RepID=A0A3B4Y2F1_SERLL
MTEENTDDKPQAFTENPSGVPSDEGASQTVKHKFTFSFDVVGEAPHVISELENITCSEDNTAVLECVITGEPAAEVEWYCNDIRLELTGGKYRVEVDDKVYRLYINSFTYTDAGVYKCVARNSAKTFSGKTRGRELTAVSLGSAKVQPQKFDLMVGNTSFDAKDDKVTETAPKCVIPLTNVTAAVGTPVILQCLVSGKPNPTAEWYKDGDRVADSRCIIQEKTTGHFNLLITNVTQTDSGEYTCKASNQHGTDSCTASLIVTGKTPVGPPFKLSLYLYVCLRERELYTHLTNILFTLKVLS